MAPRLTPLPYPPGVAAAERAGILEGRHSFAADSPLAQPATPAGFRASQGRSGTETQREKRWDRTAQTATGGAVIGTGDTQPR